MNCQDGQKAERVNNQRPQLFLWVQKEGELAWWSTEVSVMMFTLGWCKSLPNVQAPPGLNHTLT